MTNFQVNDLWPSGGNRTAENWDERVARARAVHFFSGITR